MKRIEILKNFHDKYTDKLYLKGDIIDFDDDRADEILENKDNLALIIEVSQASKTPKRRKKKEACDG